MSQTIQITYRAKDTGKHYVGEVTISQKIEDYFFSWLLKERYVTDWTHESAQEHHARLVRMCAIQDALGAKSSKERTHYLGTDHTVHLHVGRGAPFVIDAPYHQTQTVETEHFYRFDTRAADSLWLERHADYYIPGVTFPRISARQGSKADIHKLAGIINRVRFPEFELKELAK